MDIIALATGIIIGAVLSWLIVQLRMKQHSVPKEHLEALQNEMHAKNAELLVLRERNNALSEELAATKSALDTERTTSIQLGNDVAHISAECASLKQTLDETKQDALSRKEELREQTDRIAELHKRNIQLEAHAGNLERRYQEQKEELEHIGEKFEAEFRNLANNILEEKATRFTELNKANIEGILKPLNTTIDSFRKQVDDVYDKESKQRFSLGEKVSELVALNKRISEEANNLTHALEGNSKIMGDWGEMILENILEKSGLVKGREYFVQEYIRDDNGAILSNEDGSKMRPDVTILYPDNRKVIIDSKVSLVAYKRFATESDKAQQDNHLRDHLVSVKKHIDELSRKNYQDFAHSLDFVMMFVPIEPAYLAAMQADPEIWNYAYSRRVLLISPTNLIAALKLIADLWKREYQNQNAIRIAERGGQLYDKFAGFLDSLLDIGANIDKTQKSYDTALNRLKEGRGNILFQVESLKKLGVQAKKSLPIQAEEEE